MSEWEIFAGALVTNYIAITTGGLATCIFFLIEKIFGINVSIWVNVVVFVVAGTITGSYMAWENDRVSSAQTLSVVSQNLKQAVALNETLEARLVANVPRANI